MGWEQLKEMKDSVKQANAQQKELIACPECSEKLETGKGVKHCPFCGRTY